MTVKAGALSRGSHHRLAIEVSRLKECEWQFCWAVNTMRLNASWWMTVCSRRAEKYLEPGNALFGLCPSR